MIQLTPQMRVLVAIEPVDGRRGIDGLAQVCRAVLNCDPLDGTLVIFRTRSGKAIKLIAHDGQGFWICMKRMASGKFRYWPTAPDNPGSASRLLLTHELQTLIWGGDPARAQAAPIWRRVRMEAAEVGAS
jgi:transposase